MVEGQDDTNNSQRLAETSAENIASRLTIPDRGAFPESSSYHGGLYIHQWNVLSALVEMAYLQTDAMLLREKRRDFARPFALAILSYLDQPATCADEVTFMVLPEQICRFLYVDSPD